MKLLVATDFSSDTGGGGPAVVRQMLQGFPGEIHWWSVRGAIGGRDSTEQRFSVASFDCCPPGKLLPAKKLPHIRAFLMEHLWAPRAAESLQQTIKRVRPDCLWVVPHDWSIFPLARALLNCESRITAEEGRRLHVTIQDYPDAHFHGLAWGISRVERMAQAQEALYAAASTCDATSVPMLKDLQTRTGRNGLQVLHKGLEPEDFAYLSSLLSSDSRQSSSPEDRSHLPASVTHAHSSPTIKIAYAGTILCEPEFALFVELLDSLLQKVSPNANAHSHIIELHFYGGHSYVNRRWLRPWMVEHGNLNENDLITELRKCHWGFIPMSLDNKNARYNLFSFPTKFITYLAAGLPIISMGDPESSVMKMASAYNVGLRIENCNSSLEDLANALFVPNSKQAYLPEILRCGREQFEAEAMRKKLWQAFGVAK